MIASSSASRVGHLEHDDRHLVQAGALRRAPAPLAGDDLEIVRAPRAARTTIGWMMPRSRIEAASSSSSASAKQLARIARIGLQRTRSAPALAARARSTACDFVADVADQRGKSAPQSRPCCLFRHGGSSQFVIALRSHRFLSDGAGLIVGHPRFRGWIARVDSRMRRSALTHAARNSFSRWMISVASRR